MLDVMRQATRHQPLALAVGPFLLDMAYTFRTGTVASAVTMTASQPILLASLIYHLCTPSLGEHCVLEQPEPDCPGWTWCEESTTWVTCLLH